MIQNHPAGDHKIKNRVQQRLSRYEAELPADSFAEAIRRGEKDDLETVIATLQNEWIVSPKQPGYASPDPAPEPSQSPQPLIEPLTPRELEVLRLVAEGLTNREIAQELVIAKGTVKAHLHNIHSKLAVSNRTEAAARARELDLF